MELKKGKKEVILFGDEGCIYCVKTKEWLTKNKVAYVNKDVTVKENFEEFEEYNAIGIPLVVVIDKESNQKALIKGYLPRRLENELLNEIKTP